MPLGHSPSNLVKMKDVLQVHPEVVLTLEVNGGCFSTPSTPQSIVSPSLSASSFMFLMTTQEWTSLALLPSYNILCPLGWPLAGMGKLPMEKERRSCS